MKVAVKGGNIKSASFSVPGDKSISHRALLMSLLCPSEVRIKGLSHADDVQATKNLVEALGMVFKKDGDDLIAQGIYGELKEPLHVLDVGNSGTLLRLVCGLLAPRDSQTFFLTGDPSIVRRPMGRVIEPLVAMGAKIIGRANNSNAPLAIKGAPLSGITFSMSVPSAQVKSAILLAGLSAEGETVVIESVPTRSHTEDMLRAFGACIQIDDIDGAKMIRVAQSSLSVSEINVAGDPSAAAFFVVMGILGGAQITIENIYLGPQRDGFLSVLRTMGASIDTLENRDSTFNVIARPSELFGVDIEPVNVPGIIDEIPILAVAASRASGRTQFFGVGELRHKESDRIASTLAMLKAFGVECGELDTGFWVDGTPTPKIGSAVRHIESHFDHRIAMCGAILAAITHGETIIDEFESVATSFPGFLTVLSTIGIDVTVTNA